ncbi:zinc ABC transporter substrate-binding protein [Isoptericola sp. NEAU-Y5]|uniref:Zinc ABC transporter substrate-binding protein n=1 Tax=Isoptericola luteus TaxID=2879484 RepID=A0ABS7ZIP9_9MICO|nr:zinc ABC transporter substrate-binding protein [Isoptericola sp. NEAU-Y5]MCA5894903.1 zinc ABC transporter substrate-binding protein [Isoptericola sp. NEAU-Y5]
MLRRRAALAALPLLALPAVLAGCAADDGGGEDGTLEVLASFYPLQFVTQQVGGDLVSVSNLTPPAAEPHDLELSPAQVREIGAANLVVFQSGFQPAVDEAVSAQAPEHVVDAAEVATLESRPGTSGEEPEEGHDEHAEEGDGHDHGALDPHFWLDPMRLVPVADAVAQALTDADPANADAYAQGAAALTAQLEDLDGRFSTGLQQCETRVLVTSHEAFGYLAERYDLTQIGIVGLDPEAEPSPARLREVGEVVTANDVSTIFTETLTSPKVAQTLASDLGVTTAVLNPLEGLSDDELAGGADYASVMQDNLTALTGGLRCS